VGPAVERSARPLGRPGRAEHLLAGDGRILLAGEAAGLVSPSSGEGISFALESGAAAGRAAATGLSAASAGAPGAAYAAAFAAQARRVRAKFLKARVIFSPRWRRLALRIPWCP
jgi:flavin-dependent dehydrogenase